MLKIVGMSLAFFLMLAVYYGDARSEKNQYELIGEIDRIDKKSFRGMVPVVFLHSATTPFITHTLADFGGKFKFKNLRPGLYTLTVQIPRYGELRKTVDVGPSFADSRKRVLTKLLFDREIEPERSFSISAVELSVPENARKEFEKAQERLRKHDVERAVEHLKRAVELAPQFSAAWNNLGTIAYKAGNYDDAEKCFREALKQEPGSYAPLVNLGGTLLSAEKLHEALPYNIAAVEMKPDDALAHSQLGQNYCYLGNLGPAEEHLKRAKALDPSHFSYPQLVLARIYDFKEDFAAVVRELEEFLKLHPDSPRSFAVQRSLEYSRAKAAEFEETDDSMMPNQ